LALLPEFISRFRQTNHQPFSTLYLVLKQVLVIIPVAVEKLALSEESRNLGDRKCLGDSGKSFMELPDAKEFLRNRSERVFQQPPLFSTGIWKLRLAWRLTGSPPSRPSQRNSTAYR
jgi:hypothetical protein